LTPKAPIDPVFAGMLRVAVLRVAEVAVRDGDDALTTEMDAVATRLRNAYGDFGLGSVPGVQEARALYRSLGIDPTRVRPSSEALLRRVLKGQGLPRINTAVDVANLTSLESLLPVGLYDAARIEGDWEIRLGRPGEGYPGIRKDHVRLDGRIAVCDRLGPFGNPTADSGRTQVTAATRELLFLMFAPAAVHAERLARHVDEAAARFARHAGAARAEAAVLEAGVPR
jgi:DNA/RNA-binding domain of Phe-tRNA-synthetase-like protein